MWNRLTKIVEISKKQMFQNQYLNPQYPQQAVDSRKNIRLWLHMQCNNEVPILYLNILYIGDVKMLNEIYVVHIHRSVLFTFLQIGLQPLRV